LAAKNLKVDLIFFDAGGGHRAAATALKLSIERQGLPWQVRLVNLQEIFDSIDLFRQIFDLRAQDVYNLLLRKGWTLGSTQMLVFMHSLIRLYHPIQVRLLKKFWQKDRPDAVISVVPNFNRALYQAIQKMQPGTPYVVILTDLADYPPHFWIEENQPQIIFCGSERAQQQARELTHPASEVHRVSGMILHPKFYDLKIADRREERRKLGLDPDLPTGLILFGGYGSGVMPLLVKRLARFEGRLQLIAICGRNEELELKMRQMKTTLPLHVEGFTTDVPYFMQLSDFFIGKPGPGSISEALAMKLPVIVERNSWTLPQEQYNAEWIKEKKVGLVLRDLKYVGRAVETLLEPRNFARFKANAEALNNRAVFEIPAMLAQALKDCDVPFGMQARKRTVMQAIRRATKKMRRRKPKP
jgi:1,2-diacylglycerol 3-beta-galactosyltransferase